MWNRHLSQGRQTVDLSGINVGDRETFNAYAASIDAAVGECRAYADSLISLIGVDNRERVLLTSDFSSLDEKGQKFAKRFAYTTLSDTGRSIAKNPFWEGPKREQIIIPKKVYSLGGFKYDFNAFTKSYFSVSAKLFDDLCKTLESMPDCKDLLEFEKSAFKKCVLVTNGISGVSGINSVEKPWSNFSDNDFDDDVYNASIDIIRRNFNLLGFEPSKVITGRMKGLFEHMKASMPVVTSCGYPFRIKGQDMSINAVGAYLNAYYGASLLLSTNWLALIKELERDFYNKVSSEIPMLTHVYGPRTSAYSKPWAITEFNQSNASPRLYGKGVLPRKRFITIGDKLAGSAVKDVSTILLMSFQQSPVFQTDSAKLRVVMSKAMREGFKFFTGDKASADSTYMPKWPKRWIKTFFGDTQGITKFMDLFALNGDAPVLGPSRSEIHEGFLFDCGKHRLSSGVPHTTLDNNIISDLATRQVCKEVFGTPYYEHIKEKFICWHWGDDGQFAINEKKAGIDLDSFKSEYTAICAKYGLEAESDPGCLFLSTYYNKSIKTNIVMTLFKNLFQPERMKDHPIICTVALAAHSELLKEHPCYKLWEAAVNQMIKVLPVSFVKQDVKSNVIYATSEEGMTELIKYGTESGERSKKLRNLIEGLTQGLSSSHSNSVFITKLYSLHTKQEQLQIPPSILNDIPPSKVKDLYLSMLGGDRNGHTRVKVIGDHLAQYIKLIDSTDLVDED